jgi:hypothetical protein
MRSIYRMSANLFMIDQPHTSSCQILDGKPLIPFWTKGNMTRPCSNHCSTHYTRHCTCSRPNYKMQLQECHQSLLVLFCTQHHSVSTLVDGGGGEKISDSVYYLLIHVSLDDQIGRMQSFTYHLKYRSLAIIVCVASHHAVTTSLYMFNKIH